MEQLRISAKQLGNLVKENFCPRCFYIGYTLQFKLPGSFFAGILSKMDSIQKKSVVNYYEKYGRLPAWLEHEGIIGKPLKSPGPKKFNTIIADVVVSGSIDLLLETPSKELIILDFKTASPKNGYDPFMVVYDIQLQGYAKIAKENGLGKVKGLYLVYFSADTQIDDKNVENYIRDDYLQVPFTVEIKKLTPKPDEAILPLVEKFKDIVSTGKVPDSMEGCMDCEQMNRLSDLVVSVKPEVRIKSEEISLETRGLMIQN
jgi:hypothetical protein